MAKNRQERRHAPTPTPWWQSTTTLTIAIVAVLGVLAFALFGFGGEATLQPPRTTGRTGGSGTAAAPVLEDGVQVLRMTATDYGYSPNEFQVEANKPVKLVVDGQARGCGAYFVAPTLGLSKRLEPGPNNEFAFTPEPGRYEFSCAMNMISGVIVAV